MNRQHIHALLDAHHPADPDEAESLSRIRRVLAATDHSVDLFDKRQTDPGHVTASAIATDPTRSQILLIHHPAFGLWIQPGGHTDPTDPSLPSAAARELHEETGLTGECVRLIGLLDVAVHHVPDGIKGQAGHLHLDFRFAFEVDSDAPLGGEEDIVARWFQLDALELLDTDDSVRAAARRLSRP